MVWINGERARARGRRHACPTRSALLGVPRTGVAVAVDGEVVPRARWAATVLADGARVEVLTAVQGG